MTDGTGITSYSYDPYTGAISTVTFPDAKVMTYDYDANGNRTQMNDPFGFNTFYHYDTRNRLDVVGPSNDFTNDYDAKYQYFNDDLLKQITQRNGVTSVYSYSGKQVESLTEKKANGSALNAFSYTYDPNGNEKTRTENGTVDTFTYDELNRLETSTQFNETYAYDSRGNRQSLKTNHPFDRPDGTTAYDKRDRLTSVTKTSGGSVTYRYNGDGLLWERTENGKTTRYYWDGDQITAEASVTGGVATLEARYIRGQGLIAREDSQGKAYYVANGHGDIVNVTDNSGLTKLNAYSYDGFGNIEAESETVPQPFKYSGEMQDESTGLQYLRARWYDPSIGRFIGEDTVDGQITNPLSLNLYTYVENNPLIYTDPSGQRINDDKNLSKEDQGLIAQFTNEFFTAQSLHDVVGMQRAHDKAVSVRLNSGKYEMVYRTNYETGASEDFIGNVGGVREDWVSLTLAVPAATVAIRYLPTLLESSASKAESSVLKKASETAFKAADEVDTFSVSNKHLLNAGGRWQKFSTDDKSIVNNWVKEGLESPSAQFLPNNQPNSFKIITDLGENIGAKGETKIQIIIGEDSKIWTAFPVK